MGARGDPVTDPLGFCVLQRGRIRILHQTPPRLQSLLSSFLSRSGLQVQQKQSGESDRRDSGTPVRDADSQYGTWDTGLRTDDR